MEAPDHSLAPNQFYSLRERIKNKYRQYHLSDPLRFPDFAFNTNRTNYEPLRDSFEEELFVVKGIDRANLTIHIPSTNTLALIFTDDSYVSNKKILNTCRLYIGYEQETPVFDHTAPVKTDKSKAPQRVGVLLLVGLVLLIGSYLYFQQHHSSQKASRVTIAIPNNAENVSRLLHVEGKATNADSVWLVVRPFGSPDYYVQTPVKVNSHGRWKGRVIIGSIHAANSGVRFQIQAFIKPELQLGEGDVLNKWPKSEVASNLITVVRSELTNALPTDDIAIYKPSDGQKVPCETIIQGKAANADTIWVVVSPEGNPKLWVQSPIKVEENGIWQGKISIGEPGMADVGWIYTIRAFADPIDPLKRDDILYEWPKAKRSSGIIQVIRGPQDK
ncbi:MAG: hypothetical protein EAZ91_16975 [Cytophagales bacterium]|nr:MAG: hypothetical protein EAZ91_16975 [Cytophagales bacterium]